MLIREAKAEEVPALAALKRRAFAAAYQPLLEPLAYEGMLRDATPEWFQARVADGHTILVPDDLSALAVFGPNTLSVEADRELRNVYVEPGLTSRGTGRAITEAAFGRMREEGHGSVCLGVFPQNLRAVRFYERLGFVTLKFSTWENNGAVFEDQILRRDL